MKRVIPSTRPLTISQVTDGTAKATAPAGPVSTLTPARKTRATSHDDRGEQAELDEQLRGQPLLRGRCAGGCPCPYRRLRRRGGGCPAATPETARFVPPNR
jgi:hypothetical protein